MLRFFKNFFSLCSHRACAAVPSLAASDVVFSNSNSSLADGAADHTITEGIWKGSTWSYDAAQQILTVNGVELYLQRETDWEASPRTHTIVYAGYANNKTYWGKKSK